MASKRQQRPDDEKLRELILYVSTLSEYDPNFGATKLNKLLFYTDFLAYQKFGSAITGQEYQALPQGPAPKRLKPIIERMKRAGDLRQVRRKSGSVRANTTCSDSDRRSLEVHRPRSGPDYWRVQRFWNWNATQISTESHFFLGWQLGIRGETIPYSSILIGNRKPTEAEKERSSSTKARRRSSGWEPPLALADNRQNPPFRGANA